MADLDELHGLLDGAGARRELAEEGASLLEDLVASRLFPQLEGPARIGRFEVVGLLGSGGMGTVYAGRDPADPAVGEVAIKVVRGDAGAADLARLRREARLLERVEHPNLVRALETGVDARGQLFLVMELVEGEGLERWLGARARGWAEVLALFVGAGEGLAAAHAAGVIHRDFKPGNILVEPRGRARLVDFGLARLLETAREPSIDDSITATGHVSGTPGYMAPEVLAGARPSAAADIYGFCVAALEALSHAHLVDEPPAALIDLLLVGVAPDPGRRWPSMDALLTELRAAAPAEAGGARGVLGRLWARWSKV